MPTRSREEAPPRWRRARDRCQAAYPVARIEEQIREAALRYMWADAGLTANQLTQSLAKSNPMRWSSSMSPGRFVQELRAETRPLRLELATSGHRELRCFHSAEEAATWAAECFHAHPSSGGRWIFAFIHPDGWPSNHSGQ